MKYLKFLRTYVCLLLGFAAFTACTSDEEEALIPEGKGYVKLSLNADAGFQTKAVDESYYGNEENYTVQILDKEGSTVKNWKYTEIPEGLIELANGSYVLKAFCGEDKNVSTSSMYVEGTSNFDIDGDEKEVSVTCTPVCARVTIVGEGMDDLFSDWYAMIGTKAQDGSFYKYSKDGDPVYLKVEKNETISVDFTLTQKSNSKITTINKTYTANPNEALKITLKPAASENGSLGITITIDGSTNDETIDIKIPSDWV